jgi:hypothetical protein
VLKINKSVRYKVSHCLSVAAITCHRIAIRALIIGSNFRDDYWMCSAKNNKNYSKGHEQQKLVMCVSHNSLKWSPMPL